MTNNNTTTVKRGRIIKHGFRDYGFIIIIRKGDDVECVRSEHVHYSEAGAAMLRGKAIIARRAVEVA
jgi:hypothetical protein